MRPILLAASLGLLALPAKADIALSSNDGHTVLDNGVQVAAKSPLPDSISVIDMGRYPPRIIASLDAPGSVVGPPMAIAIARDESWAIVTSATKADPAGTGGIGPDDRVSVIELRTTPPKLVQSLTAGAGATVVRMTQDGTLALVANRTEGTISVFTIKDKRLTAAGKIDLGNPKAGPSGIVITPDGKSALVSRDGDSIVSLLHIDGTKVTVDPRPITTAYRPYTMDINAAGTLAAVSNMGRGDGDIDSVSLIDLTTSPPRTVETLAVPGSPEGLKFSPDGRFLAVGSQDGTTKPNNTPFRKDHGTLTLLAVDRQTLKPITSAPIGHWNQGIAFSRDGKTLMVQNMLEQHIQIFRWNGKKLLEGASIRLKSGPASFATSWP